MSDQKYGQDYDPWNDDRKSTLDSVMDFFRGGKKKSGVARGSGDTPPPKQVTETRSDMWTKEGDEYVYHDPSRGSAYRFTREELEAEEPLIRWTLKEILNEREAQRLYDSGMSPVDILLNLIELGDTKKYSPMGGR